VQRKNPIRVFRTKQDDSENICVHPLNFAATIFATALTQNFPPRIDRDSAPDSFSANEAGRLNEHLVTHGDEKHFARDYFFRAFSYG